MIAFLLQGDPGAQGLPGPDGPAGPPVSPQAYQLYFDLASLCWVLYSGKCRFTLLSDVFIDYACLWAFFQNKIHAKLFTEKVSARLTKWTNIIICFEKTEVKSK